MKTMVAPTMDANAADDPMNIKPYSCTNVSGASVNEVVPNLLLQGRRKDMQH